MGVALTVPMRAFKQYQASQKSRMEKAQIARAVASDGNERKGRTGMIYNRLGMVQVAQVPEWA